MSLIVASIFNFALVIFILWYFGRKPVGAALVSRSEAVAQGLIEGEKLSKEASALLAEWEGNWRSCEAHARKQFEEAKALMAKVQQNALSSAATEAERVKREGSLVGKSEVEKSKKALRDELVERSVRSAQTYLEGNLTDKDRHKLIIEYVEKVSNGAA